MGTRSTIAIENLSGTFEAIYCHFDGYLEHNGKILSDHYTDTAKVRALIALGDISSLGEEVAAGPNEIHSFEHPAPGVTVAYGRCRGDQYREARVYHSFPVLQMQDSQEYTYVYSELNRVWSVARSDNRSCRLLSDIFLRVS